MSITQDQMNTLKAGDTVTIAIDSSGEVRTGQVGRVDDFGRAEFAFEGELSIVYPMSWVTEVTPREQSTHLMVFCQSCHKELDENTLQLQEDGFIDSDAVCLDCFHIHHFGHAKVKADEYAAAGWDVPKGVTLATAGEVTA